MMNQDDIDKQSAKHLMCSYECVQILRLVSHWSRPGRPSSPSAVLTMTSDPDPYIFSTDTLPADRRFLPPLANGLLGWRVYSNTMHMGGVYNGEAGRCHRADVPCPLAVEVGTEEEEPIQHAYTLDTHTGERSAARRGNVRRRQNRF